MTNKNFLKKLTVIAIVFLLINILATQVFAAGSVDDAISGGDSFISSADSNITYNKNKLNEASSTVYNMLSTLGMIVAVVVGIVLGIKYMMGSTEEKAQMKETLVPYITGCIVIFAAFTIWKLIVSVLSTM